MFQMSFGERGRWAVSLKNILQYSDYCLDIKKMKNISEQVCVLFDHSQTNYEVLELEQQPLLCVGPKLRTLNYYLI